MSPRAKRSGHAPSSRRRPAPRPAAGARIRAAFAESLRLLAQVYAREAPAIERMGRVIAATVRRGRTVFFAGNGGSAAEAQHFATELVGRYVLDRRALPAIALSADSTTLTAVANDYGYERIFARGIEALGRRGDLLIAMTTSGRSRNVLAAVHAARRRGMRVIGMTGGRGRGFARLCDDCLVVPSDETPRVQEVHLLVGHLWCGMAETAALGPRRRRP
ncbi:MAG TPA: D-sedoheptulose 7-phosphate isomerase [Candidatus Eisenbacteria bacterium]